MTYYHDEIQKVKDLGFIDFLKVKINESVVTLRPIDESDDTVNLLKEWRIKYWDAFPTKFTPTFDGTKIWLRKQIIDNTDRILFLIMLNGKKIGHIGTFHYDENSNSVEIDNVLRGVRGSLPGLMENVLNSMFEWMFSDLKLSKIQLRVFSDNYKGMSLYERCNMLMVGVTPLKRVFNGNDWNWIEVSLKSEEDYGERYFSIMEITKNSYLTNKRK